MSRMLCVISSRVDFIIFHNRLRGKVILMLPRFDRSKIYFFFKERLIFVWALTKWQNWNLIARHCISIEFRNKRESCGQLPQVAMAEAIIEDIQAWTALKMDEYKKIHDLVIELERREEALKSRQDSEAPAVLLRRRNLGDQIWRLKTEIELVWADLHSHRGVLMSRLCRTRRVDE